MQSVVYAYVKGTEVRFRKAPSLEGQIIDSLNDGQQVQVLAITGEWTHVQVGDQKGYIFSQYLVNDDPAAVKKPDVEQAAASAAPDASPSPSPSPSPAAASTTTTTTTTTATNASNTTTAKTTTASGDQPSNAIENSPLANGVGSGAQSDSSGDDDVTVSAGGPTSDAGAAQANLASETPPPSSSGGSSISSRPGDPSEIAVPANEYPTDAEPTAVDEG